jgi:hypothetical protein
LIRARGLEALECFLAKHLDYNPDQEHFKDYLLAFLEKTLPEDQAGSAQTLVDQWSRDEADVIDKIDKVLASRELNFTEVLHYAAGEKVKELMREYVERDPDGMAEVDDLLMSASMNIDSFMADALAEKLYQIERIDHLTAVAETRRNDSLSEIDRRRAALGQALRRTVQEIEDGEFKVIGTTPGEGAEGKDAA